MGNEDRLTSRDSTSPRPTDAVQTNGQTLRPVFRTGKYIAAGGARARTEETSRHSASPSRKKGHFLLHNPTQRGRAIVSADNAPPPPTCRGPPAADSPLRKCHFQRAN
ncbi:hypothetical protein EVAR_70248_1 [Eumeta japonica]|uniref:Uncharacterized protein n=1 Tax=Eumeta variegata TaxID=151549 RepID=A0A4C2A7M3_EUMVA|nr:hypothetical protein EVAR_70248_1 [Eumeta japonica]